MMLSTFSILAEYANVRPLARKYFPQDEAFIRKHVTEALYDDDVTSRKVHNPHFMFCSCPDCLDLQCK